MTENCRGGGLRPSPEDQCTRFRAAGARGGRRTIQALLAVLLLGTSALPVYAWGRKIKLARKYRPGQKMVYQTKIQTRASVRSNPSGLQSFLPPLPTEFSTRQQNTVTVRAVHPDGTADVENHFDVFEFHSDFAGRLPEGVRDSAERAQQEFSQRVNGQALMVHYDREGRLLGFEGGEEVFGKLDTPLREPLRQVLRLFLEQMGGNGLYPDHPVKPREEWKRTLTAQPSEEYPFHVEGESTLSYSGKAQYRGSKAAVIDFRFTNVLKPALESLRRAGPLAQLEAQGMELEIRIDGLGQGRLLMALDDGRVLQNHARIHQTLTARLKGAPGVPLPIQGPITLEVNSDTLLEMDGSGK